MAKEKDRNWIVLLVIIILAVIILAMVLASLLTKNRLLGNDSEWEKKLQTQAANDYERMRVALWQASQGKYCQPDITICCQSNIYINQTNQIIFSPLPGY